MRLTTIRIKYRIISTVGLNRAGIQIPLTTFLARFFPPDFPFETAAPPPGSAGFSVKIREFYLGQLEKENCK
jgi:hypothetical protein